MCPKTGSLVVESSDLEVNGFEPDESSSSISSDSKKITSIKMMSAKFDDPLEAKQSRRRLSSSHSASSITSGSSYRPHLQFQLSGDNTVEENEVDDKYDCNSDKGETTTCIELHIMLRSDDPDVSNICQEGIAHLDVPKKFENLPISMDLPIIQTSSTSTADSSLDENTEEQQASMIQFSNNAYIRILLSLAPDRHEGIANDPSKSHSDLILSENLDEIQLGGMVKLMHEKEEIEEARQRAAKLGIKDNSNNDQNINANNPKRRNWIFWCNGSNDFNHSFQTFFDVVRGGCDGPKKMWTKTKCMDPNQDLFLSTTMASTIDTRDSLEI
jgi:hypothetical protein